ncbi:DUF6760 family protein [Planctomycetota bacterium]
MDKLYQEVGYVAYHFHWSREEILNLNHSERHRWIKEISEINKRINAVQPGVASGAMSAVSESPRPAISLSAPRSGSRRSRRGMTLTSDPEAVRRALAEREARERRES